MLDVFSKSFESFKRGIRAYWLKQAPELQIYIPLLLRSPLLSESRRSFWAQAFSSEPRSFIFDLSSEKRLQLAEILSADQMVDASPDCSSGGTTLYAKLAIWLIRNWNYEGAEKL